MTKFRQILFIYVLLSLATVTNLATRVNADTLPNKVYLPIVLNPPCLTAAEEAQLAQLLGQDPQQQRPSLTCNYILAQVARDRAADMAERKYFSHVNPDGYGPNYLVEQAGYVLPDYYGDDPKANYIESIAAGNSTATATWQQQWMNSPSHREHLLGLNDFYKNQIEYGIGYAYDPDSPYKYYWVVITAQPGP
ncbi:MAG TPA: CAP domain-containing protein [Anaerolineae bacterium]|nr:hypothetical protein [Anaerolineae bacterium]MCB0223245.1 hypothetical protein [Anaerolineae bacterium]HRV94874.1 CAP domain-containing protein [Anaerolineae bacterium]